MYITIFVVPGLPQLPIDVGLSLWYTFLFVLNRKEYRNYINFPFKSVFILLLTSWSLSSIFSMAGVGRAFTELIKDASLQIIIIWVIWYVVRTKSDYSFLLKGFVILFFFSCLYGIYEYGIKSNPIMEYELAACGSDNMADFSSYENQGRGYRVRSFFVHAIGGATNWSLFVTFLLTLKFKYKISLPFFGLSFITIVLSVACIFFSNSRGPLVFLFICLLCIIDFDMNRLGKKMLYFLIIVILCIPLIKMIPDEFLMNVHSIFDRSGKVDVVGSDEKTRYLQLAASLKLLLLSPIFGLGYKFMDVLSNSTVDNLFGLESIWFRTITYFGLLGVFANLALAYYSIWKIPRHYKSKQASVVAIAYWVVASLTSLPGFHLYLFYLVYFYYIKFPVQQESLIYKRMNLKKNIIKILLIKRYIRKRNFISRNFD